VRNRARIRIDRIACDGRGFCAEFLPELITLDDWGFPIISAGVIPENLLALAHDVVEVCPKAALWLEAVSSDGDGRDR